jgi:hypothetical protein
MHSAEFLTKVNRAAAMPVQCNQHHHCLEFRRIVQWLVAIAESEFLKHGHKTTTLNSMSIHLGAVGDPSKFVAEPSVIVSKISTTVTSYG